MGRNGGVSAFFFFFLRLAEGFPAGSGCLLPVGWLLSAAFRRQFSKSSTRCRLQTTVKCFFFFFFFIFFPSNHTVSDSQLPCACQRLQVLHRPANELPMRRGFSPFGSSPFPFRFPGSFGHGFPSLSIGALLPLSPLCWDIGGCFSGTLQGQELQNIAGSFLLRSLDPFCI